MHIAFVYTKIYLSSYAVLLSECSKGRIQLTWLLTFESHNSKHNWGDSITASGENMVHWEDDLIYLSICLLWDEINSVEKPLKPTHQKTEKKFSSSICIHLLCVAVRSVWLLWLLASWMTHSLVSN